MDHPIYKFNVLYLWVIQFLKKVLFVNFRHLKYLKGNYIYIYFINKFQMFEDI